jgi:Septum formation
MVEPWTCSRCAAVNRTTTFVCATYGQVCPDLDHAAAAEPPADRSVDPDGPATDAASTPTDGSAAAVAAAGGIPGWTPPPWSPDAADTRPFWRRIPAGWLIAGALVLVGAVAGWYFRGVNTTTTGGPNATVTVTQSADASRSATGESDLSGNPHDYKLRVVDLRVGDCFDLKDPPVTEGLYVMGDDEIKDVKAVPCTTEHEFEVFYIGAMGKGSYPTDDAFGTYVTQNCNAAFGAYIGEAYDDSDLIIYWLVPTDDAWRSGDRTVQCAAYQRWGDPLTRSLRGARQ